MRSYLDNEDKYGELRLYLSHPSNFRKKAILVEGKSDKKAYSAWLADFDFLLEEVPGSRRDVIEIVTEFATPSTIAGICDSDFDNLIGIRTTQPSDGIFYTDWHDAEMGIWVRKECRERVLCETLSGDTSHESSLKSFVESFTAEIGALRFVNHRDDLRINFSGLKISNVYDKDLNQFRTKLVDDLNTRSPNRQRDLVITDITNVSRMDFEPGQLCQGHDVVMTVCLYLRNTGAHYTTAAIDGLLRLSFTKEMFAETQLGAELRVWLSALS